MVRQNALTTRVFVCLAVVTSIAHPQRGAADIRLRGNSILRQRIVRPQIVLQQGRSRRLWDWVETGERLAATQGRQTADTTANPRGRWRLEWPARQAAIEPSAQRLRGLNFGTRPDNVTAVVGSCLNRSTMDSSVPGNNHVYGKGASRQGPQTVRPLFLSLRE